tara:strand:- start:120 stop:323 length:204 start_codon:yes stop_codon:yes gene_type:complete
MKVKPKSNDYYKKYRYLIWRDDIGFLHLETFSSEELLKFSKNIDDQLRLRAGTEDQLLEDANIKTLD